MDLPGPQNKIVRFGLFETDVQRRALTRGGVRVRIQEQPFQILVLLLERHGEIVTREELQQKLWPADTYVAFDDGLNTAVKKLRVALGDSADNPRFIETIPRRGYRFLAPVSSAEPVQAEQPSSELANSAANGTGSTLQSTDKESETAQSLDSTEVRNSEVRRSRLAIVAVVVLIGLVPAVAIWRRGKVVSAVSRSVSFGTNLTSKPASTVHPDPRAREEYIQARNYWTLRTAEALTKAVDHYNAAIEFDPHYAEAYAGLADCYVVMPLLSAVPADDAYGKARQAADKAVALGDSVAQAHLAAAEVKLYLDWNFPIAEKEFRRAVELDPNDPQAHQWYAEFLSLMSRHQEAISQIRSALSLDPSSMIVHHQAGQIFRAARMYTEALEEFRRALMIQPNFGPTYAAMGLVYRAQGRYQESIEATRQSNLYWDPGGTSIKDTQLIADAYKAGGKPAFFRAELAFHEKHPGPDYDAARDYGLLGDREKTLHSLQQALANRRPEILNMRNDPEFDPFRADPEYKEIVKRVGFP
jgi:tetratricopeptide (TPR) repeat protein/DNA-binding winged helix-turn-helix (wHTH) protein